MLSPDRLKRICALALPVIGGMISQNVLNLVDTAMVGVLGNPALAAVGIGGFALFMSQALILGLATGVQAMSSRRKGQQRFTDLAVPLNAGLLLALLFAPPLSLLLYNSVPTLYPYLNADPAVIAEGVPYLQTRMLAIVFVGMNFSFRGFWSAIDQTRLYMMTLVIMHSLNIVLNYALIFGNFGAPELGVTGAGLASAIATAAGTLIYLFLGFKHAHQHGFLNRRPSRAEVKTLVSLSLPNSIQQFFFAGGFVALYWIIGQVGTRELAAANVLINIMLVAILPGIGFGISAATLVGQALGREQPDDAARWGWDVVKVGVVAMALLGIPMWLLPDLLLSAFIHDAETLGVARTPMRLVGGLIAFEAVGLVLMNALLGAGDTKRVMMVSVIAQWGLFLPLAYLAGPVLGFGLLTIWLLQSCYRALMAASFALFWHRRSWVGIQV